MARKSYEYREKKRKVRTMNCDCKVTGQRGKDFMSGDICRCHIYPKGYGAKSFTYENADVEFMYLRREGTT